MTSYTVEKNAECFVNQRIKNIKLDGKSNVVYDNGYKEDNQ